MCCLGCRDDPGDYGVNMSSVFLFGTVANYQVSKIVSIVYSGEESRRAKLQYAGKDRLELPKRKIYFNYYRDSA